MKALSCVYMACCVLAMLYIGTTMTTGSFVDIAAVIVMSSAVLNHVDHVFHIWFG